MDTTIKIVVTLMNWCMDCGIRIVNEPNTEIYCAQCEAKYNKEIGKPLTFEWLESDVDSPLWTMRF